MQYVTLANGVKMPILGYGVYQVSNEECERCVLDAISVGYRSIDTAQAYHNEEAVGSAIEKCGVPRDELFLTTKVWISNAGYERAKASIDASLKKLRTDYIDLLLIHQPFGDYYGTWRAMEEAYRAGKLRAIGVSNFYPDRLVDLCKFVDIKPMVNQVEYHPLFQQKTLKDYCGRLGIKLQAYSPLMRGEALKPALIQKLADKYNKTPSQIVLRWDIQSGVIPIPKSAHTARMRENISVFDFTLDEADMAQIAALDEGKHLGADPDKVDF